MDEWIPIQSISGMDEGWIRPEAILSVSPGCQRVITWRCGDVVKTSSKAYGFPDDKFLRILRLGA